MNLHPERPKAMVFDDVLFLCLDESLENGGTGSRCETQCESCRDQASLAATNLPTTKGE